LVAGWNSRTTEQRVDGAAASPAASFLSALRHRATALAARASAHGVVTGHQPLPRTIAAISRQRKESAMRLTGTTTISRQPQDVYDFWRHWENLPTFMAHLDEVRTTEGSRSHWKASAPFGRSVEWDAEVTEDLPGQRICWRSTEGADVDNQGIVSFKPAPGGRGTEVRVEIDYKMPAGKLGEAVARYFGEDPHQQIDDDLRRFKQVIETGEVVRSEGAPGGKRARQEFPQHPAQPLTADELAKEASA
jgi:uncharacterized membrane protein